MTPFLGVPVMIRFMVEMVMTGWRVEWMMTASMEVLARILLKVALEMMCWMVVRMRMSS